MPKPYDATVKLLEDLYKAGLAEFIGREIGLPADTRMEPLDADLSTLSPQADKLFRLWPAKLGLLHIEVESSWAGDQPNRSLLYNVIARHRYGGPVRTVILLLRRGANAKALTGMIQERLPEGPLNIEFHYTVIRLWELPCDSLMEGSLGAMPLALLTDDATPRLPELVEKIEIQMKKERVGSAKAAELRNAIQILLGLRYDNKTIQLLYSGVKHMRESSVYQAILAEGEKKGEMKGEMKALRGVILELGQERFGKPAKTTRTTLTSIRDLDRLSELKKRLLKAKDWDDLLGTK